MDTDVLRMALGACYGITLCKRVQKIQPLNLITTEAAGIRIKTARL